MKRSLLLLLLLSAVAAASAQTREIFRKSIGGAIELGAPDGADFGLPSWYNLTKIDSVIFHDNVADVVASNYRRYSETDTGTFENRFRYTVDVDPQFNRSRPADSLRHVLELRYGKAETRHVTFVGLIKKRPAPGKRKLPAAPAPTDSAAGAGDSTQAPVHPPEVATGHVPLFAGGTALFALALCGGIFGLYRRAGASN